MALILRRAAAAARHRPAALLRPAAPISNAVARLPDLIRPAPFFHFSPRRRLCALKEFNPEITRLEADGVTLYGSTASSISELGSKVDKLSEATADKAYNATRAVGNASYEICGVVVSSAVALGVVCLLILYIAGARAANSAAGDHVEAKFKELKVMLEKKIDELHQGEKEKITDAYLTLDSRAAAIKAKEQNLLARQAAIEEKGQGGARQDEAQGQGDQRPWRPWNCVLKYF